MINSSDEAIRKVLAGIRGCEVPPEMEHRILTAVRRQASAESRSGRQWYRPIWLANLRAPILSRHLPFAVVVTGMLAVALTIPLLHRAHRVADAASQFKKVVPAPVGPPQLATPGLDARNAPHSPTASESRSAGKKHGPAVGLSDSLALRELHAVSRPAPPLPLTQEERMLLRLIRTVDPQQLAMFSSEERAKREAEADAEFQQFFGKLTAENNEQN